MSTPPITRTGAKAAKVVADAKAEIASGPIAHVCHVPSCDTRVPRSFLMCGTHWNAVPMDLKRAVWKHFQDGQQFGMVTPTQAYYDAADAACAWAENRFFGGKSRATQTGLF